MLVTREKTCQTFLCSNPGLLYAESAHICEFKVLAQFGYLQSQNNNNFIFKGLLLEFKKNQQEHFRTQRNKNQCMA